ncbi:sugar-binding domain-containing protein [Paracoccus rhizosphaerae]|uniref:Sugar-binding domain-containing protein n=2 Tax=Paracoccus rhizosphaerae TaxID=1133347 RepID=A0ABV6CHS9_9RHOB|nr:sugar-binding domain-containing protein [Paracoccus rhizosphaerae]
MTRVRVNKLIAQVREDGAVHIDVALPLTDCVELGEALAARYRLVDAAVVLDLPDHLEQKRPMGEAAGATIGKLIEWRALRIATATGRTLSFAVRALHERPQPDSRVLGLTGGVTRSSGTNTL